MADTYLLVHGAWHTGAEFEAVADAIRAAGCTVHCPTLAGNRPGDDRATTGLADAIDSLVHFIEDNELFDITLVGHSYAGMVISGVADRLTERLRRIVYVNAFVPLDGECLNDLVPPHHAALFDAMAAANGNALMLPFEVWRESFINDADLALARSSYAQLNPQPYRTFTEAISLSRPLAALPLGKSYLNCQQDTAMPHSLPWHPRLSERLGLFRLVECPGSHETLFSAPQRLAQAIIEAGRD
ncbi:MULTISPECIES: alpha/beta hydrolase [Burkholderiaceae]|uniref:alpha/beta hydrolase n=1 Tax=Burkholderiaceae TaxID=119060 RepID=UPI00141F7E2E|nr:MULTISPECIES: alpha/beta hydrolase [Burkholderiaceae]MBN3845904.1 alpha/beta hydrolase [Paraburkholderia sp. Ac-20342]NIF55060.1 alpha/beta hydrolase [Burkholderia sp. Ax-1724]NIF77321.1 alpha/beta hydrolase [Paraburkholderia sp. Cy-641]